MIAGGAPEDEGLRESVLLNGDRLSALRTDAPCSRRRQRHAPCDGKGAAVRTAYGLAVGRFSHAFSSRRKLSIGPSSVE